MILAGMLEGLMGSLESLPMVGPLVKAVRPMIEPLTKMLRPLLGSLIGVLRSLIEPLIKGRGLLETLVKRLLDSIESLIGHTSA